MKCPLTFVIETGQKKVKPGDYLDCLKEECAWWDAEDNCCCIYSIPLGLLHIFKMLIDIERKMPKDLAPRG